jgi:alanine racemase
MAVERTTLTVRADAWASNLRAVARIAPKTAILPVIKANAYGHGLLEAFQSLKNAHIWGFGVAYGQEALQLRRGGWKGRIVVLSHWEEGDLRQLIQQNVELVVDSFHALRVCSTIGTKLRRRPKIHMKLDTGTSRIGFLQTEWNRAQQLTARAYVNVVGVFTHFSNAEDASSTRTRQQLQRFAIGRQLWPSALAHTACSAAILRYPESWYEIVRPGIMLYGYWPSAAIRTWAQRHHPTIKLQPVLRWMTHIAAIKVVPPVTRISYGGTFTTRTTSTIATLPVGYADGLDRRLSNRAEVAIRGKRYPIVGRVCMNLMMVNLGSDSYPLDTPVELIGDTITFDDWDRAAGVFPYEAMARLSSQLNRSII